MKLINFADYSSTKPLLIAEVGGNHEGSFEAAKAMMLDAVHTDVDVVKYQIYTGDSLVNRYVDSNRHKHFQKFELNKDQYIYLAKLCVDNGKIFNASVWNIHQLDLIDDYLTFYKIGSGDLTCYPIIDELAMRGKPILLSTGLSSLQEVKDSVNRIRDKNPIYNTDGMLCVMQCTSLYPTPPSQLNLSTIKSMHDTFKIPIGYSHHSISKDPLLIADFLGATIFEFHYTVDAYKSDFRDHQISLTSDDVAQFVDSISVSSSSFGSQCKLPTQGEVSSGHTISFRRAIYPVRDIPSGTLLQLSDLIFLRPAVGIPASEVDAVVGKTTLRDLKCLQPLNLRTDLI